MDEVLKKVLKYYNFDLDELMSSRKSTLTMARHMIWFYCHKTMQIPALSIADFFGCSARAVFLGIKKIGDGIVGQRYYKDSYKEFLEIMNERG